MPTRRRRCQPRSRNTLLDYPQLFRRRPSTAATRVNNFKATDVASVSKVIHTDNQLHPGQFGKAAYTGWIRNKRPIFNASSTSPPGETSITTDVKGVICDLTFS